MGRTTAEEELTAWQQPSLYTFVGEYGPFKIKGHEPIEDTLVWLYNSGETNCEDDEDDEKDPRKHPMYPLAAPIQDMLLDNRSSRFSNVLVIDVNDMFESREEYEEALAEEEESLELTKKLGKKLLRLFQKLLVHRVALAARGELCPLLVKLYKALEAIDVSYNLEENNTIAELWLFHPQLSTKYINTHMTLQQQNQQTQGAPKKAPRKGKRKNGASQKTKGGPASSASPQTKNSYPVQLNLVHTTAISNKVSALKPFFPNLVIEFVTDERIHNLLSIVAHGEDATEPPQAYSPERCNDMGKMLFCSSMKVEMNKISKQHERNCIEITSDLLAIISVKQEKALFDDPNDSVDWATAEHHVGALLLRGNRCILVRSIYGEWEGMRIPSVAPLAHESPQEAAIRAIAHFAEVDADEMEALPHVLPVACYAPNGRPILVSVYSLYAVSPPPEYDDPGDADMEDEEDPYDWYTFPRALARLDDASVATLKCMALNLVQASAVGLVPSKWGGVFGQELQV